MRPRLFQRGRIFLALCVARFVRVAVPAFIAAAAKKFCKTVDKPPRKVVLSTYKAVQSQKKAVLLPDIISTVGGAL